MRDFRWTPVFGGPRDLSLVGWDSIGSTGRTEKRRGKEKQRKGKRSTTEWDRKEK